MNTEKETQSELAPLASAITADPRLDKFLRPSGPGTYSLIFKSSKGVEGGIARKVTMDILPLLKLRRKRRVAFSVELILYNCLMVRLYERVYSPNRIVVKYTRRRGHYGTVSKYGLRDLSYRTHMAVLQAMRVAGYIELKTEKPQPLTEAKKSTSKKRSRKDEAPSSKGRRRSSFWPSPKLVELLERYRCEVDFREQKRRTELVVVKDSEKNPLPVEVTKEVRALMEAVEEINDNQKEHSYALFVPDEALVQFYIPAKERGDAIVPVGAFRVGNVALVLEHWHQSILCLTSKDAMEGNWRPMRRASYPQLSCSTSGFRRNWAEAIESRYQVSGIRVESV